jgi:hypothetical protein
MNARDFPYIQITFLGTIGRHSILLRQTNFMGVIF